MADLEILIEDASHENLRLDKFISTRPEISSRSRAEYLISAGCVRLNGKEVKTSTKVKLGDRISIQFPEPKSTEIREFALPLDIQFEDEHILVVNKPSGLVVHPAAGHQDDTLVNALKAHTRTLSMKFGEDRPGIVHRIDKETSGLLVVAKNDFAHAYLAEQFKNHSIQRTYEAVVIGSLKKTSGAITSVIARHPTQRKKFASIKVDPLKISSKPPVGKRAVTHFELICARPLISLLRLKLETGRTHQIRVHMSEMGFPLLGDLVYGPASNRKLSAYANSIEPLKRFFLHARSLGFIHPLSKEFMQFEVNWPPVESKLISSWFFDKD